ncbi:MAG: MotA/TolQ/ExbB proton channel family protein [Planctomycetes bacterium]|nr:MotA/TolQ/ExbB proton channel family protein [Planctomycetota bacterium]
MKEFKDMGKKRAIILGAVALVALLSIAAPAWAAEEGARKVQKTLFGIFYVATFTDTMGFLDMVSIYACSIASIALIIEHAITIRRSVIVPELSVAQVKTMFDERRFREALEFCQSDPSFVSGVVHAGLIEAANGYDAMEAAMQDATGERTARLYRKIEWLNLLGNVAPMLGLLGTVWGMIVAFGELEAKGGKANPEDLAGGIMIALVSTFVGLVVAIPALAGYGIFRSRIEQMSMEAALVAEELLANFKPSAT